MRKTLVILVVLSLAGTLWARLPLGDFGAPDLNVDLNASLVLSQGTWGIPVTDANRIARDSRITPDDFAVAAFLSSRGGLSIEAVWRYRTGGASWFDVAGRIGVPMDTVICQTGRDYGPPYGKAWGYWKKHPKAGDRTFFLDDNEFIRLVEVQTLCKATGKGPDDIIKSLQGGESYTKWAGKVGREKHGKGQGADKAKGSDDKGNKSTGSQGKPPESTSGSSQGKGKKK